MNRFEFDDHAAARQELADDHRRFHNNEGRMEAARCVRLDADAERLARLHRNADLVAAMEGGR